MELVTGAMGSLLPKLGELLKEEYKLQKGVRKQVQFLSSKLEIMHVSLRKVAEVPCEQLDEIDKLWVRDVRELSYDMEDVVDTFLVHVEDGRLKTLVKKMGNLFSKGKARHQIADAIKDMNKQIQEVDNRHGRYTPANIVATHAASTSIDPHLQALHREARESKLPTDRNMEFVTGTMGSLLPKLGELLKEEYKLQKGIRVQVQSLSKELETMYAALRDVAKVPLEQLDPQVKFWAHDVMELSYNIENIVNTFMVCMEDGREATPNPHRLKKLVKEMGNLFSKAKARHQIAIAIQDINNQIQKMDCRRRRYMVDSIVVTPAASASIDPLLQALHREARESKLPIDRTMEFVTGAMGSLLPKLGELLKEEYKLQKGIRTQVQSLSKELETMYAVLRNAAKVPHEQLNEQVKLWAHDVRELSYNIENIVNTFMVCMEYGCEATPNPHRLKKLVKKMGNLFSKAKARHQIAIAIQDINKQIQEVANRFVRYMTHSIMATPVASMSIDPLLQANREVAELTGINGKRDQELIKMLSEGDDVSKKKLKIVSVVGFGGLGKTTLVRAVCNKIKEDFDCWAFVPVGRNPDMKKVFIDILLHLDKQKYTNIKLTKLDEMKLIIEIRKFLEKKRYLIIIDDIWDKKHWREIKCVFPDRNNLGSRLITTTRIVSVSQACCSSSDDKIYKMEPLSDDDSQRLFYQRIFSDKSGCPPELEQVSKDILKKCGGVPLAIITIASLLASSKQTKDEWYTLLNSIGRGLMEHACMEEMQRILSFSYYDLPPRLKTCLLYLSVFPEDYEIASAPLIWRWIAEGFVQSRERTSLFEVGKSYLNELVNRSMIQPADIDAEGSIRSCRVHDMVLDLICALSSQENFVTILDGTRQSTPNSQSKVRRLSLQNSKADETTPLVSVSQVRSITVFPPDINLIVPLSSFDALRVLDLHGCYLGESSPLNLRHVGNLFHLRYLGLADTHIRELPAEIGKLQFLQVLDVRRNVVLRELPPTVVKLRTLMCLLLVNHIRLPDGMGNLTSMEVLRRISVEGCPNIVKELRNLTRLRELKIYFPRDESLELEEAFVDSLCNLHNVQRLAIRGYFRSMDLLGERWVPPQHLRSFSTRMFDGLFSTLPTWVKRDPLLPLDLSELRIHVKEVRQEDLQILGRLSALRSLYIQSTHQTQRLLLVGADWFPCVILFSVVCKPTGHLMFQREALPRAQMVYFPFDIQMAKDDGNGDFDLDLGNLLSLQEVSVIVHSEGATFGEVEEAEAALRHAVDAHPNHPTIHIGMVPHIPEAQRNPNHP